MYTHTSATECATIDSDRLSLRLTPARQDSAGFRKEKERMTNDFSGEHKWADTLPGFVVATPIPSENTPDDTCPETLSASAVQEQLCAELVNE